MLQARPTLSPDEPDLIDFVAGPDRVTARDVADLRARPALSGCATERDGMIARGLGLFLDRLVADLPEGLREIATDAP